MSHSSITEEKHVLTVPFTIRSYEADPSWNATVQTLCNYFQEVAWQHATQLGFVFLEHQNSEHSWFLLRLHVKMFKYPRWGDQVFVSTWPSGVHKIYAYRDFKITSESGEALGVATSSWIVIDLKRRRPMRVPDSLIQAIPPDRPRVIADAFSEKLLPPQSIESEHCFHVRLSDIDVNGHVNNVNYIEWAIEAIPRSWRDQYQLAELDVEFKSESTYGDHVTSQMHSKKNDLSTEHRVFNQKNDKALMIAHAKWKNNPKDTETIETQLSSTRLH